MKKIFILLLTLSLLVTLAACEDVSKADVAGAQVVMERFMENTVNDRYEESYNDICKYDKNNISKEVYIEWCKLVSKIRKIESYTCTKNSSLKNREVVGVQYEKVVGFEITMTQKKLISSIEMGDSFKRMVVFEDGEWKVLLGYQNLQASIDKYTDLVKEYENKK
jgi:hypothetical protein